MTTLHPSSARAVRTAAAASLATALSISLLPPRASSAAPPDVGEGGPDRVIAWNDLGMHCGDPDYSVFSILPPFNTINSQLLIDGKVVVQGAGITVTYEAVADASGSINSTSIGKSNFWEHSQALFGAALPEDVGLTGSAMPGPANDPQHMHVDGDWEWYQGEGIPILPIDDALAKNTYPMMRVTARDSAGQVIATTVTTVPNSQELNCSLCHASGTSPFARPDAGWVFHPDPLKDDRINILRLHDELQHGDPAYASALAAAGYAEEGLEATAAGGHAILCATCHASNALPGTGIEGVSALTSAMHLAHDDVVDQTLTTLGASTERSACYQCHPGFDTQCLRGAMGRAIGPDGEFRMSCQSCHGGMTTVGDPERVGWLEQPNCQQCHTGTATNNGGAIRYDSVFDERGVPHVSGSTEFATTPDVPDVGFSLYRFSSSHGGLQCSACHGSPHAIYPTVAPNDNVQSTLIQGHAGTVLECSACHTNLEDDELLGPHGMHPTTASWVNEKHGDHAQSAPGSCSACHGADSLGTVLSRTQTERVYATPFGPKQYWDGFQVSCYSCHDGPSGQGVATNHPPAVTDLTLSTPSDTPLPIQLGGSDADGDPLVHEVVSQPMMGTGTVGWAGATATFHPAPGTLGPVSFTYAAWDGKSHSNLGTVTIQVTRPACEGTITSYGFGCPADGAIVPTLEASGCAEGGSPVTFHLENGDGGAAALLIVGTDKLEVELGPGCMVRVLPIVALLPKTLSAGGPGEGHTDFDLTLPPNLSGSLTFQGFVLRPAAPYVGTFTNGLEVRVP